MAKKQTPEMFGIYELSELHYLSHWVNFRVLNAIRAWSIYTEN